MRPHKSLLPAFRLAMLGFLAAAACDDLEPFPNATDAAPAPRDSAADVAPADVAPPAADVPVGDAAAFVPTHTLTILHTNDLHSHLQGQGPEGDYTPATTKDDDTVGGFARLATAIGTERASATAAKRDVLTLDAGDFMMGSMFQLLATGAAAELKLMKAMGFDATTIGNHELDWTPNGLAAILAKAVELGIDLPVLSSNMTFDAKATDDDNLQKLVGIAIKGKLVKTLPGGLKIGIIGLLGKNAADITPTAKPLSFENILAAGRRAAADLRATDKVDLVIALSHSGINGDGTGEDRALAEDAAATPAEHIDLIVSGHSHATIANPILVTRANGKKTVIVTAGSYGRFLGRLDLDVRKVDGGVDVAINMGKTTPIDDTIAGDVMTQAAIEQYITGVDQVLAGSGYAYRKTYMPTPANLEKVQFGESPLGNLVTDAYRTAAGSFLPTDPPVIAVEANGTIRDPILKGKTGSLWVADLFRVLPLGIGPDAKPGYPLVSVYLHGRDLRSGMELMAAASSPIIANDDYFLQVSGMTVEYDPKKPVFGRVTSIGVGTPPAPVDLDDTTKCYRVVTTYYVASLLGLVKQVTGGAFSVDAKQSDCKTPVTDLTKVIIDRDPMTEGVQELKAYQALMGVVNVFGIAPSYATTQGRIKKVP